MNPNQQRAAEAIKSATGWDAERSTPMGAKVDRPNGTSIRVWRSRAERWRCEAYPQGWIGEGLTPEAAIEAVLPRYRAHIASLAADILPGWPRLMWTGQPYARTLCLVVGGVTERILTVYPECTAWTVSIDNVTGPQRTREAVLAAVAAHVESLALPCPLPPFPGASDAS